MELIILLLIFVSLGLLGALVGADGRDGLDWKPGRLFLRADWRATRLGVLAPDGRPWILIFTEALATIATTE